MRKACLTTWSAASTTRITSNERVERDGAGLKRQRVSGRRGWGLEGRLVVGQEQATGLFFLRLGMMRTTQHSKEHDVIRHTSQMQNMAAPASAGQPITLFRRPRHLRYSVSPHMTSENSRGRSLTILGSILHLPAAYKVTYCEYLIYESRIAPLTAARARPCPASPQSSVCCNCSAQPSRCVRFASGRCAPSPSAPDSAPG